VTEKSCKLNKNVQLTKQLKLSVSKFFLLFQHDSCQRKHYFCLLNIICIFTMVFFIVFGLRMFYCRYRLLSSRVLYFSGFVKHGPVNPSHGFAAATKSTILSMILLLTVFFAFFSVSGDFYCNFWILENHK
jgi:hypothetical protein